MHCIKTERSKNMDEEKGLVAQQGGVPDEYGRAVPLGFEDETPDDVIIPRVKVVNLLSPEYREKLAEEGDIINSLTKEKLNDKVFIPVFKFNNNVWWKDRSEGGGIQCIARDGKMGEMSDGTTLLCAACKRCEFDNSKQGKEAAPTCTKYINFFGFIEGERIPVILSFAKTNYNEGKKMYSLAKVTMQNMWNHGYRLSSKKMAKGGNEWYNISVAPSGATGDADREFAMGLYKTFRSSITTLKYDMENSVSEDVSGTITDPASAEF
jgi:hypothetical protein